VDIATYTKIKMTPQQQKLYKNLPDDWARSTYLRSLQRKDNSIKLENLTEYVKWRQTIEARGRKGREMCAGDHEVETSRPAMMGAFTQLYNRIQEEKLAKFVRIGLGRADKSTPFHIPQSLGGLGLTPPPGHTITAMDYLEIATLEGCPQSAEKFIKRCTPSMPKPVFMTAVSHELQVQQDMLNIKPEFKELADIGLLRFLGEEDGFWEQSFLTGFVTSENMTVGPEEIGDKYEQARTISRVFKSQSLMQEKRRQIKQGVALGIWKVVKDVVDGKSKVVATEGETCFTDVDFTSVSIYRKYRPSPKYEY